MANFDPNQPRDEIGRWTETDFIFRHGTSLSAAKDIVKKGLKAHKATIGERSASVYFMKEHNEVFDYVVDYYTESGEGFAIVEFHIPDSFSKKILEDEEEPGAFRIEMDIPPEWIRNIWLYNADAKLFDKITVDPYGHSVIAFTAVGFKMTKEELEESKTVGAMRKAAGL